ncbi:hypothetical protein Tco_0228746 [Tanacetum coccineum]
MHNNIMVVDGDALRKCNLKGSYTPSTVIIPVVPATDNALAVPERTTVETILNIHLMKCGKLLKGYNKVNLSTFKMSRLIGFGSLENSLITMEKQWSHTTPVNEICAERIAKNANPLTLVAAAQSYPDPYYQVPKSHKSYARTSKALPPTRSHTTTRHKVKEIAKPITPLSESASEEDSDPKQAQKDKEMTVTVAGVRETEAKRVKDSMYHKENMLLCKQAKKGVPLQAEQSDWLSDTDKEIDEQ